MLIACVNKLLSDFSSQGVSVTQGRHRSLDTDTQVNYYIDMFDM